MSARDYFVLDKEHPLRKEIQSSLQKANIHSLCLDDLMCHIWEEMADRERPWECVTCNLIQLDNTANRVTVHAYDAEGGCHGCQDCLSTYYACSQVCADQYVSKAKAADDSAWICSAGKSCRYC